MLEGNQGALLRSQGPLCCAALLCTSPLLTSLLSSTPALQTTQAGRRFDVVVVDSRPLLEGRRMLAALLEAGVSCEYCHLNGLSYQITEVDKASLGG